MMNLLRFVIAFMLLLVFPAAGQGQFEFFEHRYPYKPGDVLSEATTFVKKAGYWEAFRVEKGKKVLVGYVFLSKDWTGKLVGYSGKHIETLVGMDPRGWLTGAKILFHSEPIVLIGLKEENLHDFMKQYRGKRITERLRVGRGIAMDAVTGATVTAVVENAIILGSARKVARQVGLIKVTQRKRMSIRQVYAPHSWQALLKMGAIGRIRVMPKDLGLPGKAPYLDLHFGLVDPPAIGQNVLGERMYREVRRVMKKQKSSAIFVVSRGPGSFKGAGFARGGIFDRFHLEQDGKPIVFKDMDYHILTQVEPAGAPKIREGGVFLIRDSEFDPAAPFEFNLTLPYRVGVKKAFASFSKKYRLPDALVEPRR